MNLAESIATLEYLLKIMILITYIKLYKKVAPKQVFIGYPVMF